MVERGAFAEIPPVPVIEAIYLKLGGVDGGFYALAEIQGRRHSLKSSRAIFRG